MRAPLPDDAVELTKPGPFRAEPPAVSVPLNRISRAGGPRRSRSTRPTPSRSSPARTSSCRTTVQPRHISLKAGASVTWRFADAIPHNVLFASGPRLVGSPTLSDGQTYTTTFSAPGHYELFCYLHPMTMHETVEVTG